MQSIIAMPSSISENDNQITPEQTEEVVGSTSEILQLKKQVNICAIYFLIFENVVNPSIFLEWGINFDQPWNWVTAFNTFKAIPQPSQFL